MAVLVIHYAKELIQAINRYLHHIFSLEYDFNESTVTIRDYIVLSNSSVYIKLSAR